MVWNSFWLAYVALFVNFLSLGGTTQLLDIAIIEPLNLLFLEKLNKNNLPDLNANFFLWLENQSNP